MFMLHDCACHVIPLMLCMQPQHQRVSSSKVYRRTVPDDGACSLFPGAKGCRLVLGYRGYENLRRRHRDGTNLMMRMSMNEQERVELWDEIEELQSKMQRAVDQVCHHILRLRAACMCAPEHAGGVHACLYACTCRRRHIHAPHERERGGMIQRAEAR